MRIRLYPTLERVDREAIHDATVVVIDVLRATSTIITGIENGAERIIPVEDIETASRLVGPSDHEIKLLAGERKGLPIDGFDLFNSPLEFTSETVSGKTVILTTSNGTRAIVAAEKANKVLIGAITNVGAVAHRVHSETDLVILCSGNEGGLAVEDLLCGGMIIRRLETIVGDGDLDDAGRIALVLSDRFGDDTVNILRACDRGRQLLDLGYEADILYCACTDSSTIVPELREGGISLQR